MEEFKTALFKKDELEYWDMSKLMELLKLLARQIIPIPMQESNFKILKNKRSSWSKTVSINTLMENISK